MLSLASFSRINPCFTAGKWIGVSDCHATRGHRKTTIFTSIVYGFIVYVWLGLTTLLRGTARWSKNWGLSKDNMLGVIIIFTRFPIPYQDQSYLQRLRAPHNESSMSNETTMVHLQQVTGNNVEGKTRSRSKPNNYWHRGCQWSYSYHESGVLVTRTAASRD